MIEVQSIGRKAQSMVDVSVLASVIDYSTGPGLDNGGATAPSAGAVPDYEGLRRNVGKLLR